MGRFACARGDGESWVARVRLPGGVGMPWASGLPASAPALRGRVEQENRRAGDKREEEDPPYEEEETGFGWAEAGRVFTYFNLPCLRSQLWAAGGVEGDGAVVGSADADVQREVGGSVAAVLIDGKCEDD